MDEFGRARFEGKVAIVTGAGSGIGRATASRLASEGAKVVVADIDLSAADATTASIGSEAIAVAADVSSEEDVDAMVTVATEHFGSVDILVNNAAICRADNLTKTSREEWDAEFAVDLTGPFLCCRRTLPLMIEQGGGVVINVSSVNALAWFKFEAYSAAKAGLISLTRSIAARYGSSGIRANAVAPGTVHTEAWGPVFAEQPDLLDRLSSFYPLGRICQPAEIASSIAFLASSEASWITGIVLTVDGGIMTANHPMNADLWDTSRP